MYKQFFCNMQHSNTVCARASELRVGASGEVGILGEEAAQRLLSVFAEAATCCLSQLRTLALQHGSDKHDTLFEVGLNLVLKWDADIANEETSRMELVYPELSSLHTYVFLWLLDKFCSNEDLHQPSIPGVGEIYGAFMKRVAGHRDVRKGEIFLERSGELSRRSVYVDAFRCVYHDAMRRSIRWSTQQRNEQPISVPRRPREHHVVPEEAASQVGMQQPYVDNESQMRRTANENDSTLSKRSAFKCAMGKERASITPPAVQQSTQGAPDGIFPVTTPNNLVAESIDGKSELSEVVPRSNSQTSAQTKAVTIGGACFFHEPPADHNEPPI